MGLILGFVLWIFKGGDEEAGAASQRCVFGCLVSSTSSRG